MKLSFQGRFEHQVVPHVRHQLEVEVAESALPSCRSEPGPLRIAVFGLSAMSLLAAASVLERRGETQRQPYRGQVGARQVRG